MSISRWRALKAAALVITGVAAAALLSSRTALPAPQSKHEIAYQARLLDDLGNPVNDPSLQIEFNLYEFAVGGSSLYNEVDVVAVQDGLVSTYIGPLPPALLESAADLFLGVTYGSDSEMSPRLVLGSVPFALKSKEATLPAGTIVMTGATVAPAGFLLCDGSAVSRTVYFDLFAAIGTSYGAGNGSTTFNLPDLRQRFPLGLASSGPGASLGQSGGSIDHVHGTPSHSHQVPGHGHTPSLTTAAVGNHTHTFSASTSTTGNHQHSMSLTTATSAAHDHPFSAHQVGSFVNDPSNPPSGIVGNVQGGTAASTAPILTGAAGAHNHAVGGDTGVTGNHAHTVSGTTSGSGAHSHSINGTVGAAGVNGDTAFATASDGSGSSGAANPPYQVVNYMIKF